MQQRNLQILVPGALEDLRALCCEVSAVCRAPRKAPPSSSLVQPAQRNADAAQHAVHVPQSTQVQDHSHSSTPTAVDTEIQWRQQLKVMCLTQVAGHREGSFYRSQVFL